MTLVMALILAFILAIIPHIVWLFIFIISKICGFHLPYTPFGWTALVLVLVCWLILAYGVFIGRWKLTVNTIDYQHPDIPAAFDRYKIVHISDLHLSTFDDNPQKLNQFVDKINSLEPDLVCFTGDLVTIGVTEAEPYLDNLRRIQAKDGVVSVLGNHDFLLYARRFQDKAQQDAALDSLVHYQRDLLGWKLLRNENCIIQCGSDSITVIGVDNVNNSKQGFRTINSGDLNKAATNTKGFRILLSHDPSHWSAEVVPNTDIQLTLSGHTHAAQFRIFGWSPASWMFQHVDGLHKKEGQTLYINIGLGCTVPFRIGANPEITLIKLKK